MLPAVCADAMEAACLVVLFKIGHRLHFHFAFYASLSSLCDIICLS